LRRQGGSFGERVELNRRLLHLRAEIARHRGEWS
jgi:hypothetical protein